MARRGGIDPSYIDRRPLRLLSRRGICGDEPGQAAAARARDLTISIPSLNLTLTITFGNWRLPRRRCQRFLAACVKLEDHGERGLV